MLFHVSRYFGRRLQENHPLYSKDKSSLSNIKQHSITVGLTFPVLLVWGLSVANHHHDVTHFLLRLRNIVVFVIGITEPLS